jgi:hypothetical protein
MTELQAALIGGGAAIAGGLLTGAYENLRDWLARPILRVDCDTNSPATRVENEYMAGQVKKEEVYIRARVRNIGRRPARNCRVYLTKLSEVKGTSLGDTVFKDARPISWAGWDFLPRVVPKGVDFYVDVARVSKQTRGWILPLERLFASEENLKSYSGTYRFHLLVTSDNASPFQYSVDVEYNGDWHNFRGWHESRS